MRTHDPDQQKNMVMDSHKRKSNLATDNQILAWRYIIYTSVKCKWQVRWMLQLQHLSSYVILATHLKNEHLSSCNILATHLNNDHFSCKIGATPVSPPHWFLFLQLWPALNQLSAFQGKKFHQLFYVQFSQQ